MKIIAVHTYAGAAREIANRIKNPVDDEALQQAAEEMAPHVPEGATLVPAPSSTGLNRAMLVLSKYISQIVPGAIILEAVIRERPVASSLMLRRSGRRGVPLEDHIASMKLVERPRLEHPVVVIDNVVTSGNTIAAIEKHLGREVIGLAYADARRGGVRTNPSDKPRVCISGSRGYKNLDNVGFVLEGLPRDSIIVHGGAVGVDAEADRVARELGFEIEVFNPNWNKFGKSAGPLRNREMVKTCDQLIAFWDGTSRGTASAIAVANELNVPTEVILDE